MTYDFKKIFKTTLLNSSIGSDLKLNINGPTSEIKRVKFSSKISTLILKLRKPFAYKYGVLKPESICSPNMSLNKVIIQFLSIR